MTKDIAKKMLVDLNEMEITENSGKMFQPQRNKIKVELDKLLLEIMKDHGFETYELKTGFGLQIHNKELGTFAVLISTTIPSTLYDLIGISEYDMKMKQIKEEELAEKNRKANEKKERDRLERERAKAMREKVISGK